MSFATIAYNLDMIDGAVHSIEFVAVAVDCYLISNDTHYLHNSM